MNNIFASQLFWILTATILIVAVFLYFFYKKTQKFNHPISLADTALADIESKQQQHEKISSPRFNEGKPLHEYKRQIPNKVFKNKQRMYKTSRILSRYDAKK